ncbi:unnamed protein product [Polarella glacialis]|uniref:Uncharacterized protein n=1 Tax=Polarella glacialis TaxID=89957 RepID=A0A813EBF1_POLGL|nr:unnamed protein product [Polarella glacialis]
MPTLRAWLFLARMWTVWGHDQACGMAEAGDGRCLRSCTDDPSLLQFQVARHPSSNDNSSGRRFNLSSGLGHAANSHGNSTHWHGNRSDHPGPVLIEESELNEKNKKKANVTLTADRVKNKDSFTEWLKTWWTSESECADKWLCLCEESLRTSCGWTAQVTLYMYSVYWINPQGLPSRGVHEAGARRCGGWMLSKMPRVMGTNAKCCGVAVYNGYLNAKEVTDNFDLIVGSVKQSFWQKTFQAQQPAMFPLFPRNQQLNVIAGVIFVQTETMSNSDLDHGYDHVFNIEYFDGQCTVLQSWVEKFTLGSWLGVSKENPYNWICLQDPSNWKEATGSLKDEAEGCEQWHLSRENYGNGKELPCHKINIVELYTSLCSFSFYTKGREEKNAILQKPAKHTIQLQPPELGYTS